MSASYGLLYTTGKAFQTEEGRCRAQIDLQGGVKDDQFGAGWNGIVAAVVHHEFGVGVGVGVCVCGERQGRGTLLQVGQSAVVS